MAQIIDLPDFTIRTPGELRVLVCGGRKFTHLEIEHELLDLLLAQCQRRDLMMVVIQGGAPGADTIGRQWAELHGVAAINVPADWKKHGKAAGPRRNQHMIDNHHPDLCVAMPGKTGTADMVKRCEAAKIPVLRGETISHEPGNT
jgi:hypothetical protein